MPASSSVESAEHAHHESPHEPSTHSSQATLPVMGGGDPLLHANAASTLTPPLLVLPLPLPLELGPPLPLVPPPTPPLPLALPLLPDDPLLVDPELLALTGTASPASPSPPVGAMAPPHAARATDAPNAAHREARIPVSVALEAASCPAPAPPGTSTS